MMERMGVEEARQNLANIIKRVEAGNEFMLTRYGKDVAHIVSPTIDETQKKKSFFSLLSDLKSRQNIHATPEEIQEWIDEGRA